MSTFQAQIDTIKDGQQNKEFRIACIDKIESITGRPLIVYAGNIFRPNVPNSIDNSDMVGFSDLIEGIDGDKIDVCIHSPGGTVEATERIVNLLRENYDDVRFMIPHSAFSAATLMALSGNSILMDDRSTLGPIDPQLVMPTPNGNMLIPTQTIIDGFDKARKILGEEGTNALPAYLPLISKYDLHIFEICRTAQDLAKQLAKDWLREYMRKDEQLALEIADKLSDHSEHLSHSRSIGINKAIRMGLEIEDLRKTPELRKTLWNLYCSVELYFDRSASVKLFENSKGTSWSRMFQEMVAQLVQAPPTPPPPKTS